MSNELPLSFDLLYRAYSRRVYRWAYRLLHHHETAQDVTQETFLRAWRYFATFDPAKGALSSRTRRMTVQAASDLTGYRKVRLATISLDHLSWEMQDSKTVDPQTRYAGNEEQVAAALRVLPQNERLALALLTSGYRELEIARRVGKTSRTVRTRLTNGRTHLTQALEGER